MSKVHLPQGPGALNVLLFSLSCDPLKAFPITALNLCPLKSSGARTVAKGKLHLLLNERGPPEPAMPPLHDLTPPLGQPSRHHCPAHTLSFSHIRLLVSCAGPTCISVPVLPPPGSPDPCSRWFSPCPSKAAQELPQIPLRSSPGPVPGIPIAHL